ncbi:hypothetical protein ACJW31_07G098600 [Castanea mollissima]
MLLLVIIMIHERWCVFSRKTACSQRPKLISCKALKDNKEEDHMGP